MISEDKVSTTASHVREGDLVLLFESHSSLVPVYVKAGATHGNKWGTFKHADMIGLPFGSRVRSITLCVCAACVLRAAG